MIYGRVLVADDDFMFVRQVVKALDAAGFFTEYVTDGATALKRLTEHPGFYNAAVLDISMPGMTGLEVLSQLRRRDPELPVLILTAFDREADAVFAFHAGASDYMSKPLRGRELAARVRRLIEGNARTARAVTLNDTVFNMEALQVTGPGGTFNLSTTEAALLKSLLNPPGRLVPQKELLAAGWGASDDRNTRGLYEHLRRIRSKLESVGAGVELRAVRRGGYRITANSDLP